MRLPVLVLLLVPALVHGQSAPAARANLTGAMQFDRAFFSWEAGRYVEALDDLKRLLASPDGAVFHDRVAELTGETWQSTEIAKDARAPRWSPDGRHLSYETGTPTARRVKVVSADVGFRVLLDAPGFSPAFAPDGQSVAFLTANGVGQAVVRWVPLSSANVPGSGQDVPLDAAAGASLTLIGGSPLRAVVITGTTGDSTAILRVRDLSTPSGAWQTIATPAAQPVDIVRATTGDRAVVLLGRRGAFSRALPGFAGASRSDAFADLLSTPVGLALGARIHGASPVIARQGGAVAWLVADGARTRVLARAGSANDGVTTITSSETPVQGLSIAPDGSRVAWSTMLREDWEIMTASVSEAATPTRLTREIQHDILPQFLSPTRVLAAVGEPRHRRSQLYDVTTGVRTRLFHNNSVRTVSPEYEWVASPDGARVAIVAERDGDTVTPHRHLYLVDLNAKVTHDALVARVDSNLTAERTRRTNAARMFAPIAGAVRDATAQVDVGRIYSYEKALFGFDSKHIAQPGNAKAVDYLLNTYKSFGLASHLQPFKTVAGREIDVANVVAVIPGTVNPELVYVVGAHFDSRAEGPGADDNTSGTAMILESARVLATRPQPATVMFVSFTGEEAGLRGAREFARRMKDSIRVVGALNNDMMGWSNDQRMDNTIRFSNPGIRDVQHAAAMQFSGLITYDAFYYKSTDANALFDVWGDIIGGIGSYPILGNPHYHMTHDVLETINHQQLAETSRTTVATIMLLASSPSRLTGLDATGTAATWKPAVEKGAMRYLVRWGPAADPMKFSQTATSARATLTGAQAGWRVSVKAVNARGLEGWNWASATVR